MTNTDAIQVTCKVLTKAGSEKVKNYEGGATGKYTVQQIEITEEGPLFGMVIPGSRTTLNKAGDVSKPLEVGSDAVAYLRQSINPKNGQPIVFADLSSGRMSTDTKDVVNALMAFTTSKQAG